MALESGTGRGTFPGLLVAAIFVLRVICKAAPQRARNVLRVFYPHRKWRTTNQEIMRDLHRMLDNDTAATSIEDKAAIMLVLARRGLRKGFKLGLAKGFPLDATVCLAARRGNLPLLRLAHERGAPWDPDTLSAAAYSGNVSCLAYAAENGCPYPPGENVNLPLEVAVYRGHMACVQYLIQHRMWDDTNPLCVFNFQPRSGQAACIAYALDHGVTLERATLVVASMFGNLSVVRLLYSRGFPLWCRTVRRKVAREAIPWSDSANCLGADSVGEAYDTDLSPWNGTFFLPWWHEGAEACWPTLRFGELHGAVVLRPARNMMLIRRERAQEVLRCFHRDRRPSRVEGSGLRAGLRVAAAALPHLPQDLVVEILEGAELEIREAVRTSPALTPTRYPMPWDFW